MENKLIVVNVEVGGLTKSETKIKMEDKKREIDKLNLKQKVIFVEQHYGIEDMNFSSMNLTDEDECKIENINGEKLLVVNVEVGNIPFAKAKDKIEEIASNEVWKKFNCKYLFFGMKNNLPEVSINVIEI